MKHHGGFATAEHRVRFEVLDELRPDCGAFGSASQIHERNPLDIILAPVISEKAAVASFE